MGILRLFVHMMVRNAPKSYFVVLLIYAPDNPRTRAVALDDAEKVAKYGWRVWVEHHRTGERIYESEREKLHRVAATV